MAITALEQKRIFEYLKSHPVEAIYFDDLKYLLGHGKRLEYKNFLEFFVDSTIKRLNEDKIYFNLINKFLFTINNILNSMLEQNCEIDGQFINKIRLFRTLYEESLERTKQERSEEVEKSLDIINENLKSISPISQDVSQILPYLKEIEALQSRIKDLEKECFAIKQEKEALRKEAERKGKQFKKRQDNINSLHIEINKKDKIIRELEEKLKREVQSLSKVIEDLKEQLNKQVNSNKNLTEINENLNAELQKLKLLLESYELDKGEKLIVIIQKLNDTIQKLNDENESLKDRNTMLEVANSSLEEEVVGLSTIIKTSEEEIKKQAERNALRSHNDSVIEHLIVKRLFTQHLSIDEIIEELKQEGYKLDNDEISYHLKNLKKHFNIEAASFIDNVPRYTIIPPEIVVNRKFNIALPENCTSYDILIVSDLHISEFNEAATEEFKMINGYCEDNNIHFILDGGDFFQGKFFHSYKPAATFEHNYRLVEEAISKIPFSKGIYHAIMGGNHDQDFLNFGFNPIERLTNARDDFIYLGFNHCTIAFNGFDTMYSQFMLHHPTGRFEDPIDLPDYSNGKFLKTLDEYYKSIGHTRDDSYIDLIAHFHRSSLDALSSLCILPSFRKDRFNNGAWHLKIYFDKMHNIKYMIFIPVIINNMKLISTTEISYQKLKLSL